MNLLVFAFGTFVFLITVYGVVSTGGLLLTGRQLRDRPELVDTSDRPSSIESDLAPDDIGLEEVLSNY